jgi:hypothetical protein
MAKTYCFAFSGIPITYNPKHPPLTAGMRNLMSGQPPEEKMETVSVFSKPTTLAEIPRIRAGLTYSSQRCRMGSSPTGRKIIRGY